MFTQGRVTDPPFEFCPMFDHVELCSSFCMTFSNVHWAGTLRMTIGVVNTVVTSQYPSIKRVVPPTIRILRYHYLRLIKSSAQGFIRVKTLRYRICRPFLLPAVPTLHPSFRYDRL